MEVDGKAIDRKYARFGWREFKIKGEDFYLNDRKIRIKGDSWHFMGIPQLTRRYAYAWYRALKDAGGNGVRLHAMPYPTFYLEVADEMGVCVLDESAIWASHCAFNYDEPVTWERFYAHVTSLVLRDRNHPSVMGWSVENEIRMALARYSPTEETLNSDAGEGRQDAGHRPGARSHPGLDQRRRLARLVRAIPNLYDPLCTRRRCTSTQGMRPANLWG